MQKTHHAGKIAAIQQSFVSRMVASHLLLSRKQVSPSFTSPAHLVVRQKKSKLLLDSLHAWWRKMPRYPKIQTGRMVQLCTESVGRTLLLQCWRSGGGRHNAAEKALCAICLGNKNFMFFDGERSALLYGLIGTCLLNDIDPEEYLRHILSVLPE